jgi:apolipoprotein D and lipocalin family protein
MTDTAIHKYLGLILIMITIMNFKNGYSQCKPSVVSSVDLKRYTGTWYEIARLPNSFERKLKCISATYTLRNDGRITVQNKGYYITDPGKANSINGVAWLPDKNVSSKLRVQFFWPFSGNYWIIYLDRDYKYVLIGEPSFKYLWILCRDKKLDDTTYRMLLQIAEENGYDVKSIIMVEHDCS